MTKDPVADADPQKAGELRVLAWAVFWTALFLVAVGAYELFVPKTWPWSNSKLEPYLLKHNLDSWAHNGFVIQKIKNRDRDAAGETLVIVGGSVSMEAITEDSILSERLSDLAGKKIDFWSICASHQSFTHGAQIASELGAFDGTLLLGIEPMLFMKGVDKQLTLKDREGRINKNYHYLAVPAGAESILSKHGYRDRPWQSLYSYKMANIAGELVMSYGVRLMKPEYRLGDGGYERHAICKPPTSEEDIRVNKEYLRKNRNQYFEHSGINAELLNWVIGAVHSNGSTVVLVDLPNNPVFDDEISMFSPHYDNTISGVVRERAVGYIDMRDASAWAPEDFRDMHHMREPGQIKFTEAFALKLADYLVTGGSQKDGI